MLLAFLASCDGWTERAPNVCCTSDLECAQLGLPPGSASEYSCDQGHGCRDFYCVPVEAPDAGDDTPRCGDSILKTGEQCEDGNTTSGDGCSATCTLEICGNGIVDSTESCDDGNLTCGTCSTDCHAFASAKANGTIVVVSASGISDSETFTLNDGLNAPMTFEFTKDGTVNPNNRPIFVHPADTPAMIGDSVMLEINAVNTFLLINASSPFGDTVSLTHDRFTNRGNRAIIEIVASPGFTVMGMSGGAGGDCISGQICRFNGDCLSNVCSSNICQ